MAVHQKRTKLKFRCLEIKKTKRAGEKNRYTDEVKAEEVWVVKFKAEHFIGIYLDVSSVQEADVRHFSTGNLYTPAEIAAILTT